MTLDPASPTTIDLDAPKPSAGGENRRLALLKRMGLFGPIGGIDIYRAISAEELQEAYKLVYDIFVEQGYIRPTPSKLRVRPYEASPKTATFVAKAGGHIVGVQSLVVDSPDLGLPSDGAFRDQIDTLREPGRVICEATNEAVAKEYRRSPVPTELMRCMFAHALAIGCDELLTAVSPGHAGFYELLSFHQLGDARSYSDEVDDPVVLMRLNVQVFLDGLENADKTGANDKVFFRRFFLDENPYGSLVVQWAASARKMLGDPDGLRNLFAALADLPSHCTDLELQAIRRRWGTKVFQAVFGGSSILAGKI